MGTPLFDAQSTLGFVTSQTSIIEPGIYATRYPDIQYRDLIPVDTSGSEFATSVTYYSSDKYGKADWINGNADDIPKAGTTRAQHQTGVHTAGIGYGWGWQEVGQAMALGINLQSEDAAAARRAAEEMVDRVALLGDDSKGFEGLFDNSSVTANAAPNGDWDTATAAEIREDMNAALLNIFNGTSTTAIANRLLLPWSRYLKISTMQNSTASDMSVLEYFMRHNIYTATTGQPLMVRGVRGLEDIVTSGSPTQARMIAYRYDPNVLKLHMPMPHRFLPVWQSGPLRWDVPGVMRLGGLDIRLPKEVAYVDGV